jgi:hypothetical protein
MTPTPPTHHEVLVLAAQIKPMLHQLRAQPPARQAIDIAEAVASYGWSPHGGPQPGQMHEVDREFYKLAIQERDYYKRLAGLG